jgi:two-component system KDP operon response regulator KdpE
LTYLVANHGHILSQRQILEHVWGPEYGDQADYVKVFIRSLRSKIEASAQQPRYIISRRGLGYTFVADPVVAAARSSA